MIHRQELGVPVVGHLAPLLLLLVPVGGGPGVLRLSRPGGGRRIGGGVRRPGTVPRALIAAVSAPLVTPEVGHTRPRVGRGLGAEQLPRLLGVALLQVVPLVGLVVLEARRLLALLLEERLELQFLFLLELPAFIVLQFLHRLLLLFVDDL